MLKHWILPIIVALTSLVSRAADTTVTVTGNGHASIADYVQTYDVGQVIQTQVFTDSTITLLFKEPIGYEVIGITSTYPSLTVPQVIDVTNIGVGAWKILPTDASGSHTIDVQTTPRSNVFSTGAVGQGTLATTVTNNGISIPFTTAASIPSGSIITMTAQPISGYAFGYWNVIKQGETNQQGKFIPQYILPELNQGETPSATVTFEFRANLPLYISAVFLPTYTVTLPDGQKTVPYGRFITITAPLQPNKVFSNWIVTGPGTIIEDKQPSTKLQVLGNTTVTAVYNDASTLTINTTVGGTTNPPPGIVIIPVSGKITATPSVGYAFKGWTGDASVFIAQTQEILLPPTPITGVLRAEFQVNTTTLTYTCTGNSGINGPPSADFGSQVLLTPNLASDETLLRWEYTVNGNPQVATTATLLLVVDEAQNKTINLVTTKSTQVVFQKTGDGILVTNDGSYPLNTPIAIEAQEAYNSIFTGWEVTGNGTIDNTLSNKATLVVTGPTTVTAKFITATLCDISATEGGTVNPNSHYTKLQVGTVLSATASTGYIFKQWLGDIQGIQDANSTNTTITGGTNLTLIAAFTSEKCNITTAVAGGGGILYKQNAVVGDVPTVIAYGAQITLYASTTVGSVFSNWEITTSKGTITDNHPVLTYTIQGDTNFKAIFSTTTYNVILDIGSASTTWTTLEYRLPAYTSFVIPDLTGYIQPGYTFAYWDGANKADVVSTSPEFAYGSILITAPKTIKAVFSQPVILNASLNLDGTAILPTANTTTCTILNTVLGGATYRLNQEVFIKPTAGQDAYFLNWAGDNAGELQYQQDGSYKIVMGSNKTVKAIFASKYKLTYSTSTDANNLPNGAIVSDSNYYKLNETAHLQALPNIPYKFKQWVFGNNTSQANPLDLPITKDLSIHAEFERQSYPVSIETNGCTITANNSSSNVPYQVTEANGISTFYADLQDKVVVNIVPASGNIFTVWTGTDVALLESTSSPTQSLTVMGPISLIANTTTSLPNSEVTITLNNDQGQGWWSLIRLDTQEQTAWRQSNQTLTVTAGNYAIKFSLVPGYIEPESTTIAVGSNPNQQYNYNYSNNLIKNYYSYNHRVDLTPQPIFGYVFDVWSGTNVTDLLGQASLQNNQIIMNGPKNLHAAFKQVDFEFRIAFIDSRENKPIKGTTNYVQRFKLNTTISLQANQSKTPNNIPTLEPAWGEDVKQYTLYLPEYDTLPRPGPYTLAGYSGQDNIGAGITITKDINAAILYDPSVYITFNTNPQDTGSYTTTNNAYRTPSLNIAVQDRLETSSFQHGTLCTRYNTPFTFTVTPHTGNILTGELGGTLASSLTTNKKGDGGSLQALVDGDIYFNTVSQSYKVKVGVVQNKIELAPSYTNNTYPINANITFQFNQGSRVLECRDYLGNLIVTYTCPNGIAVSHITSDILGQQYVSGVSTGQPTSIIIKEDRTLYVQLIPSYVINYQVRLDGMPHDFSVGLQQEPFAWSEEHIQGYTSRINHKEYIGTEFQGFTNATQEGTVVFDSVKTVYIDYISKTYTLTVNHIGNQGKSQDTITYPAHQTVRLPLVETPRTAFHHWEGTELNRLHSGSIGNTPDILQPTDPVVTIKMDKDVTYDAIYVPAIYVRPIQPQDGGYFEYAILNPVRSIGELTQVEDPTPAGLLNQYGHAGAIRGSYSMLKLPINSRISLIAANNAGYTFKQWVGLTKYFSAYHQGTETSITADIVANEDLEFTCQFIRLDPTYNPAQVKDVIPQEGLVLWLNNKNLPTTLDGSGSFVWRDASPNQRHAIMVTGTEQPVVKVQPELNNQKVAHFSGSQTLNYPRIEDAHYFFIVCRNEGQLVNRTVEGHKGTLNLEQQDQAHYYPLSLFGDTIANGLTPNDEPLQAKVRRIDYPHLGLFTATVEGRLVKKWQGVSPSTTLRPYGDNKVQVDQDTFIQAWYSNTPIATNRLTGNIVIPGFLTGDIAEVLVYNRFLDDQKAQSILSYLYAKYITKYPLYQSHTYGGRILRLAQPVPLGIGVVSGGLTPYNTTQPSSNFNNIQTYAPFIPDYFISNGNAYDRSYWPYEHELPLTATPYYNFEFMGWTGNPYITDTTKANTTVKVVMDTYAHAVFAEKLATTTYAVEGIGDAYIRNVAEKATILDFKAIDKYYWVPGTDESTYIGTPTTDIPLRTIRTLDGTSHGATERTTAVDITFNKALLPENYKFTHFTVEGTANYTRATEGATTIRVYSNFLIPIKVIAHIIHTTSNYDVSVTLNPNLKANLTISDGVSTNPPGTYVYKVGTRLTLEATQPQTVFTGWESTYPAGLTSPQLQKTEFIAAYDASITAKVVNSIYALTILKTAGGTVVDTTSPLEPDVTGTALYQEGTQFNLLAKPNPGYKFSGWSGPAIGILVSTITPANTITLTAPIELIASFERDYDLANLELHHLIKKSYNPSTKELRVSTVDVAQGVLVGWPDYFTHMGSPDVANLQQGLALDEMGTQVEIPSIRLVDTAGNPVINVKVPVMEINDDQLVDDLYATDYIPGVRRALNLTQLVRDLRDGSASIAGNHDIDTTLVDGRAEVTGTDTVMGNEDAYNLTDPNGNKNLDAILNSLIISSSDPTFNPNDASKLAHVRQFISVPNNSNLVLNTFANYPYEITITYWISDNNINGPRAGRGSIDPDNLSHKESNCVHQTNGTITCRGTVRLTPGNIPLTPSILDPMTEGVQVRVHSQDLNPTQINVLSKVALPQEVYPNGEQVSPLAAHYILRAIACYLIPGDGKQIPYDCYTGSTQTIIPNTHCNKAVNGITRCLQNQCSYYSYIPATASCNVSGSTRTVGGRLETTNRVIAENLHNHSTILVKGQAYTTVPNQDGSYNLQTTTNTPTYTLPDDGYLSLIGQQVNLNNQLTDAVTCVKLPCPGRGDNCQDQPAQ